MYPQPPPTHRPTNYYWILVVCLAAMLGFVLVTLRTMAGRFNAAAGQAPIAAEAPSAPAKPRLSIAPEPAATASAAPAASDEPAPNAAGIIDVDAKALTESPASYRSRLVRIRGTVFYTGKVEGGKTWVQIVDSNNVYVDGQLSGSLPSNVTKGVEVTVTGIGAGLTAITASNGKDYDQAYIDPIQSIEPATGSGRS